MLALSGSVEEIRPNLLSLFHAEAVEKLNVKLSDDIDSGINFFADRQNDGFTSTSLQSIWFTFKFIS